MKPVADPDTCWASGCDAEATTTTTAGPMCGDHARDVAEMEGRR